MRLRHRLNLLFAAFAVLPLLAMGAFDYASSLHHLEAVLTVQTEGIADRAADELKDRLDLQTSDIGLLSTNAETQRLLEVARGSDSVAYRKAREAAKDYWQELWRAMRLGYWRVALYDAAGRSQFSFLSEGDTLASRGIEMVSQIREVTDLESSVLLGRVEFSPRVSDLFGSPVFRSAFGAAGRTFVIDRTAYRVLLDPTGNSVPTGDPPSRRAGCGGRGAPSPIVPGTSAGSPPSSPSTSPPGALS